IFGGQVGSWSVKWQQQIPKLLLFAILINFSRMICSLVIDIGQVIMLTFANAIKDIAGGNIIQVFGLADFVTLDNDAITYAVTQNEGVTSVSLFTSALLALIMTLIVLGTMVILTIILVYRIVTLWVLVVLSPLAFFFGGAEVLSKGAGDPYAEWWKKFSGAVAIGPVLVFFLWLTLSVAGSGNIAATENFPMGAPSSALGEVGSVTGFTTKIAEPGRLLSFIIGIGMMVVGFEAAQKFASAIPGAAGLLKGGVTGALKVGAGAGAVAGAGALAAGNLGAIALASKVGAGVGAGIGAGKLTKNTKWGQGARKWVGQGLTKAGASKWAPGFVGRGISRAGTSLEQSRREDAAKRLGEHSEQVKNYNKDEIDAGLQGNAITPEGNMKQNALRHKVLSSAYLRKKYSSEDLSKMFKDFKDNGGEDAVNGDSKMAQEFTNVKKARPDLLSGEDKQKILGEMEPDELLKMDPEAYRDEDVQSALSKYSKYDAAKGIDRSYLDLMQAGKLGNKKQQEVLKEAQAGKVVDTDLISDEALKTLPKEKQTTEVLDALALNGRLEVIMQSPEFQIQNLSENYVRNNAATLVEKVAPKKLQELGNSTKGNAFREGIEAALNNRSYATGKSEDEARKTRGKLQVGLVISSSTPEMLGSSPATGYDATSSTFKTDEGRRAFETAVKQDPSFLLGHTKKIEEGGNDLASITADRVDVSKLRQEYRKASSGDKDQWRQLIEVIHGQMADRFDGVPESLKNDYRNRMRQLMSVLEN
ncbi:MAG: hypothetical protein UY81_C0011G0022, partial [Candidatus Giovannonibacteria bacterium GW2011_GWA2_53_7]